MRLGGGDLHPAWGGRGIYTPHPHPGTPSRGTKPPLPHPKTSPPGTRPPHPKTTSQPSPTPGVGPAPPVSPPPPARNRALPHCLVSCGLCPAPPPAQDWLECRGGAGVSQHSDPTPQRGLGNVPNPNPNPGLAMPGSCPRPTVTRQPCTSSGGGCPWASGRPSSQGVQELLNDTQPLPPPSRGLSNQPTPPHQRKRTEQSPGSPLAVTHPVTPGRSSPGLETNEDTCCGGKRREG